MFDTIYTTDEVITGTLKNFEAISYLKSFKSAPFQNLNWLQGHVENGHLSVEMDIKNDRWDAELYVTINKVSDEADYILMLTNYLKPDEIGWVREKGGHGYSFVKGDRTMLRLWWD